MSFDVVSNTIYLREDVFVWLRSHYFRELLVPLKLIKNERSLEKGLESEVEP